MSPAGGSQPERGGGAGRVSSARCTRSPDCGLWEVTGPRLTQARWEPDAWGPGTPPKPDSARCTGVQVGPFMPEENVSWCPQAGLTSPVPKPGGGASTFFQPEARHRLRNTGRDRSLSRTGRGAQGSEKGRGAGLVGKGHGGTPPPIGHWSGRCPQGCRPGQALAKPCCPIAGTGGPSEIRAHWASLASLADDKPRLSGV